MKKVDHYTVKYIIYIIFIYIYIIYIYIYIYNTYIIYIYIYTYKHIWVKNTYYQRDRDHILNRAKDYYKNDKGRLRDNARKKYRNSSEKRKQREDMEEMDIIIFLNKIKKD